MNLLALTWIGIIAFCIFMYVLLDGFTLGTGILFAFFNEHERDIATSVILPTWDGNQTWLVLGGASLYGAFPAAFSLIMPALYVPLLVMVIGLLFRGAIFEFRLKATKSKRNWDYAFFTASLVITLIQGIILGDFIAGFLIIDGQLQPYYHHYLNLFTFFTGLSLVCGYCLLGATRLILKTCDTLRDKAYRCAWIFLILVALAMLVVSVWTPLLNHLVFNRWFGEENWLFLLPLPLCSALAFGLLLISLYQRLDWLPYYVAILIFAFGYIGCLISTYPYIIPYHLPFWQAAAPDSTLKFILVGAVIMLPVLLFYTGYSYQIFRGKVREKIGY